VKVTFTPLIAILTAFVLWGGPADAQVRVRGGYHRPFYRPYFYGSLWYGSYFYPPFYWYPYPAFGYGYGRFDGDGSLRVQVMPRDTEVYIDNYYAGTVDDFDGMFQRLHVGPGAHDITLYREGYRTVRQRIYIQPTGTFRLRYNMVPLGPGEIPEPRPVEPPPPPVTPGPPAQAGPNQYPPPPYPPQPPPQRGGAPYPPAPPASSAPPAQASASLSIRVQPAGADVFIDGERWEGGDDRLVVQVAAGTHHIEVRRDGYRTYATDITARPGETSMVNISLTRQ
jgi:PEGA domain